MNSICAPCVGLALPDMHEKLRFKHSGALRASLLRSPSFFEPRHATSRYSSGASGTFQSFHGLRCHCPWLQGALDLGVHGAPSSRPVDANCCGYPRLTKSCRGHGPKQAEWVFQTVRCGSHMGSKDRDRRLHQKAGCMSARPSFHSIRTRGGEARAHPAVSSWADSFGLLQRGRPCMSRNGPKSPS